MQFSRSPCMEMSFNTVTSLAVFYKYVLLLSDSIWSGIYLSNE